MLTIIDDEGINAPAMMVINSVVSNPRRLSS
jgi:hypothetical protein